MLRFKLMWPRDPSGFASCALIAVCTFAIAVTIRSFVGDEPYAGAASLSLYVLCLYWFFWQSPTPEWGRARIFASVAIPCFLTMILFGDHWVYVVHFLIVAGLGFYFATPDEDDSPSTFGSAEWASLPDLRASGLLEGEGFRLGKIITRTDYETLSYSGERHLLTVAPTRAGKGVSAIIPNLLTYEGSALVIDPKGENAMVTANARAEMGHSIHIVDPWGITACGRPSRFNPLDWLARGDVDVTENAMLLADALVVPQSHGERFWSEEAKALLQGFILYVATDEREEGDRHLGRVRDLLLLSGDDMQALFERMADSPHHVVASTGTRCLQKEEKLLANVIASAQAETHFLDSTRLRESLSESHFRFEDLKKRPMTIYLVLPADRLNAFGRWLRLLIQQAITVNARDIAEKPAKPVLFLLDEMPALGKLSMVEQAFGLMAGFGMQIWAIAQDLSQLKRIYGESWESFVSNAGAIQYFGSRDRMTAEYFSALCGVATRENVSRSINRSARSKSRTETTSQVQRRLAFADELMRLPTYAQLVLLENHPPIMAAKVPWFQDPELSGLGRIQCYPVR